MKIKNLILLAAFSSAIILSASCTKDKDNNATPKSTIDTVLIRDLKAGPIEFDTISGRLITNSSNQYILFRFSDSTVVSHADSATSKWDIGFYCSNIFSKKDIILNSGIHGPGTAEGQIVDNAFEDITEAPENGYEKDEASGNVFTNFPGYQFDTHLILPDKNQTYIIHTNDGKYVKLRILSLYKGMPAKEDLNYKTSELGYYSFEYVIQQDAGRDFTNE